MHSVWVILKRDMTRFFRDKERIAFALAAPVLLLVIFGGSIGGAMNSILSGAGAAGVMGDFSYAKYMFPGIVATTTFTSVLTSASSIVHDRKLGFLNVILVSPIARWKLALGKILVGTLIGIIEAGFLFLFAPLIGMRLNSGMILRLLPLMLLVGLAVSSLAVLAASFIKSFEAFQGISGFLSMVVVFLSGAFIPISGLPSWLRVVVKLNPLTYAVDMMRKAVLPIDRLDAAVKRAFGLDLTLFGRELSLIHEQTILVILAAVFLAAATLRFAVSEYA